MPVSNKSMKNGELQNLIRKLPSRPHKMARVPVRYPLQVILVLRLRLPKISRRRHLRHHFPRPQPRRLHILDRLFRHLLLLRTHIKNRRPVTRPPIIPLPILRRRIVNLKKELQQLPKRHLRWIKNNLNRLGMRPMIPIRRMLHLAPAIPHPRRHHPLHPPNQILHPPKSSPRQNRPLRGTRHRSPLFINSTHHCSHNPRKPARHYR